MQVPTTSTFSSRHKESKDLADGNALLIQERDHLKREVKEFHALKEAIVEKSGFIPSEYAKVEEGHFHRIKELEDRVVKARIELGELETLVDDKRTALKIMTTNCEVLTPQLVNLVEDIKVLTNRKENAVMSTEEAVRKYDLLITEKSKELALLTNKVNAAAESHIIVTKKMEKRIASVVEQERYLTIRRTDLEIYEARLRKKYPNENIIL